MGGGSVLPTSRTTGHLYAKGSPEPQLLLTGRSLAKGLRTQPVPYKWGFGGAWFCQKMRAQMLEIPWDLHSNPQTFLLCLGLFFLLHLCLPVPSSGGEGPIYMQC